MQNAMENSFNYTLTENAALTLCSTHSECLDLFATIGALRRRKDAEIIRRFQRAYAEDANLAMRILFFARDVCGGLGERRVFRTILRWLAKHHAESVCRNVDFVAEFGRYDDLLCLLDTPCQDAAIRIIRDQLQRDQAALAAGESISLLAKWLPSANASSPETIRQAKRILSCLGMEEREYRKLLSKLRGRLNLVENHLRLYPQDGLQGLDYARVPAKALMKYAAAFHRMDPPGFEWYLRAVEAGRARIHTSNLMPYEIVAKLFTADSEQRRRMELIWKNQEDFTRGENALVVIDGSGSMYHGIHPRPIAVALSLGLYYAERNTGAFANQFITFSMTPRLVHIQGETLLERVKHCMRFNEVANTNLQAVFDLILAAALTRNAPQDEMPARLYIISDMEFDACVEAGDVTNFECAKQRFAAHGYCLPEVIFWNVDSRRAQQPVHMNEQGVALVSGCSPRLFQLVNGASPYRAMLDILGSERYQRIAA